MPYSVREPLDGRIPITSSKVSYGFPTGESNSSPGRKFAINASASAWVPQVICGRTRASSPWKTACVYFFQCISSQIVISISIGHGKAFLRKLCFSAWHQLLSSDYILLLHRLLQNVLLIHPLLFFPKRYTSLLIPISSYFFSIISSLIIFLVFPAAIPS